MDFIDMVFSEYVVSCVGVIIGILMGIAGEKSDKEEVKKIGNRCFVIFLILAVIVFVRKNHILDTLDTTSSEQIETQTSENSSELETVKETELESTEPESTEQESTEPKTTEQGNGTKDPIKIVSKDSTNIPKIEEKKYAINPISEAEISIPTKDVAVINGIIKREGEYIDYPIAPDTDGVYRFEYSNVPDGMDLTMQLLNEGGELLDSKSGLDNGDGLSKELTAGRKYYLRVKQYSNLGTYTLKVGQQKSLTDISYYTKVNDSIQYKDQENRYIFVPQYEGTHRFEFSNVPDGTDLSIYIYNTGWEFLDCEVDLDNGDGATFMFKEIKPYYIIVRQYNNIGSYTLNIGNKKSICDISSYNRITDYIQYMAQENDYRYTPEVSGNYRIEFDDVPDGTDFDLYIYNSGWEFIYCETNLDNQDGITIELSAGKTYYIRVKQYNNIGKYTLKIGEKKAIVDITQKSKVSDSIQYYLQENDYSYTTSSSGTYTFKILSMPAGMYGNMYVYNSGWEQIDYKTDMDAGDSLEISLESGKTYYVRIKYNSGYGEYTLKVN